MAEEFNVERRNDDNVLSIVDLLAICLRYRRLIIGLPLVAALVALIGVYLLPLAGVEFMPRSYSIQINTKIEPFSKDIEDKLDIDIVKSLNADFASTQFVLESYSKFFPMNRDGSKSEEVLARIQNQIIKKDLVKSYDPAMAVYTLRFRGNDKEKAKSFLSDLWDRSVTQVEARLAEKYSMALDLYKQQLDVYDDNRKLDSASVMTKSSLLGVYKKLLSYQSNPQFPFGDKQDILIVAEPGQSRVNIIALVFFCTLFTALITAFLLNFARGVRNDPVQMAKLVSALKRHD